MKRLIPTNIVLFALILTACGKQEAPPIGVLCNPGTYAMRQEALGQVFDIAVNTKSLGTALAVQRLANELSEVCKVADQNRARIFATNGSTMDSENRVWVLPKTKSNLDNLSRELQIWSSTPTPLTARIPVKISGLPDSVKARIVRSGLVLVTDKLIDFGDL